MVLTAYGSYVLFVLLHGEYAALLGEQFIHETTSVVVESDPRVALQYLAHAEAILVALFLLCTVMGAFWCLELQ